jgi:hypothetical protein
VKQQVLALSLVLAMGAHSQAQTNTAQPAAKPGTPSVQPGQPSAQPGQQQGQPNQMGQQPGQQMPAKPGQPSAQPGQQQGQPNQMDSQAGAPAKGGANWTPEKCEKEIPRIVKMAENCLKVKAEDKRRACFDQIGKKAPAGMMEGCRSQLEAKKAEFEAKEKSMYPNQASGMNGNNNGPQQGQPSQGQPNQAGQQSGQSNQPAAQAAQGGKKVDCAKIIDQLRKEADKCLKVKETPKRKMCFEKAGKLVQSSGAEKSCSEMLNSLKSEVQGREAQMYPGQPSSIQ